MSKKNIDLEKARHSLGHILAMAMLEIFPQAKLGIGPTIENGFYYDFDLPRTLNPEDLLKLEKLMREIIGKNFSFNKSELSINEAMEQWNNQEYKQELIQDLESKNEPVVSVYKSGDFIDLCAGPHIKSSADLRDIGWKLDRIAGAYWRGDEKRPMLQRVYGLAFETKKELENYLHQRQEAERRDHRKIGLELDLFSFHEEGPGFAFWHPKGLILWNLLLDWWRQEHKKAGYAEIKTPILLSEELWHTSGHWDHYKENMYFTMIDKRNFAVKPMNCPGSILIYKNRLHSYREFPMRLAEIGLVHRHELAGVLHGLMRVRSFHQDDAHIYCLPNQIESEIIKIMELVDRMYGRLGLDYHLELSTRPKKGSIGSEEMWRDAEGALKTALKKRVVNYKLNPGEGAFYGPKIDFHITDAIGRTWQTGTIQLDFAMPERFKLGYAAEDGSKQTPVMIHRTVFGSLERFIGILIEHFAGAFPLWLAPIQAIILPIAERHLEYAREISQRLKIEGLRQEVDEQNESIGKKIREAELQKIPYMLIVGDKEVEAKKVAVRRYGQGDKGQIEVTDLLANLVEKK